MTTGFRPVCYGCAHFRKDSQDAGKGNTCTAFPGGIPKQILLSGNKHAEPLPGQKNKIVFQKKGLGGIS